MKDIEEMEKCIVILTIVFCVLIMVEGHIYACLDKRIAKLEQSQRTEHISMGAP